MKLQNNYTTQEQSKRLLELGVPADSADCYYMAIGLDAEKYGYSDFPYFMTTNYVDKEHVIAGINIPCWSVGRLMEIYCLCSCVSVPYIYYNIDVTHIDIDNDTFINQIINNIKESIEEDDFDLSKLED